MENYLQVMQVSATVYLALVFIFHCCATGKRTPPAVRVSNLKLFILVFRIWVYPLIIFAIICVCSSFVFQINGWILVVLIASIIYPDAVGANEIETLNKLYSGKIVDADVIWREGRVFTFEFDGIKASCEVPYSVAAKITPKMLKIRILYFKHAEPQIEAVE